MKKIVFALSTIVIIFLICSNIQAKGVEKVSYNGKVHTLATPLLSYKSEDHISLKDASAALGFKYAMNKTGSIVNIRFSNFSGSFRINTLNNKHLKKSLILPIRINGNVFLPLNFIEKYFKLKVDYQKQSGSIYVFQGEQSPKSSITGFSNLTYGYSISFDPKIKVAPMYSGDSLDDSIVEISDSNGQFSGVITTEKLDAETLIMFRTYLNDFTSTDEEMFQRFVSYKGSFFNAMADMVNNEYLFGSESGIDIESNFKIFKQYSQDFLGETAEIKLFNILESNREVAIENSHLSIMLPVPSTQTIFTMNFTVPKGMLKGKILEQISQMATSLRIKGLKNDADQLMLFYDFEAINQANAGIYPDPVQKITYTSLENKKAGYQINYPSAYLPYHQNLNLNWMQYQSFKADYTSYFSISISPTGSEQAEINNNIDIMRSLYKDRMNTTGIGKVSIMDKELIFFTYELDEADGKWYYENFYIISEGKLYTLQLVSRYSEPSIAVQTEFYKTVLGIKLLEPEIPPFSGNIPYTIFTSPDQKVSFLYPASWDQTRMQADVDSYAFRIKDKNLSPVNVYAYSFKINPELIGEDNVKQLLGLPVSEVLEPLKTYKPEYMKYNYKLLDWNISQNSESYYIYKLINYLDSNGSSKQSVCVDIVKNYRIYTLCITIDSYSTLKAKVIGQDLLESLAVMVSTFRDSP